MPHFFNPVSLESQTGFHHLVGKMCILLSLCFENWDVTVLCLVRLRLNIMIVSTVTFLNRVPLDVDVHQGWFNNARHFRLPISVEFVCVFISNNRNVHRQASVDTVDKPFVVRIREIMGYEVAYHGWWNRCIIIYSFLQPGEFWMFDAFVKWVKVASSSLSCETPAS